MYCFSLLDSRSTGKDGVMLRLYTQDMGTPIYMCMKLTNRNTKLVYTNLFEKQLYTYIKSRILPGDSFMMHFGATNIDYYMYIYSMYSWFCNWINILHKLQ